MGRVSPEVHDHLHCFERVELQVVKTAPDSHLLNLLSASRLITVLYEADECGVIYKLQELDRRVFRGAVIGVQGEEQWGEDATLRGTSLGGAAVYTLPSKSLETPQVKCSFGRYHTSKHTSKLDPVMSPGPAMIPLTTRGRHLPSSWTQLL